MLTQYAFSILFIDKKKAKFSNDRFGLKCVSDCRIVSRNVDLNPLSIAKISKKVIRVKSLQAFFAFLLC